MKSIKDCDALSIMKMNTRTLKTYFEFWFYFHGSVWYNFENVAIDAY